jgi:hypothetical protein
MAKQLTIKATQIVVDSIYDNTKKCALDNISKDMQTNSDYKEISFVAETIRKLKAEVSELEDRNKKAVDEFNKTFGHEFFYLKRPYWGDEKPEFDETGLRSAIESDVVIANLGDSVDFDVLKKKLEEKYA